MFKLIKNEWGGKRENSGRKSISLEEVKKNRAEYVKKEYTNIRIYKKSASKLQDLSKINKISIVNLIDKLAEKGL